MEQTVSVVGPEQPRGLRLVRRVSRLRGVARLLGVTVVTGVVLGSGVLPLACPFLILTGVNCPFCGGSRMCGALLRLDFGRALRFNAFALLVLIPIGTAMLIAVARRDLGLGTGIWPRGRAGRWALYGLGVATLAWWVLRALPVEPFQSWRV